jgi:hypothetical protein
MVRALEKRKDDVFDAQLEAKDMREIDGIYRCACPKGMFPTIVAAACRCSLKHPTG